MATEALEETLQQLTEVASAFLERHRALEDESIAIQAELDALDRQQEKRAQRIVARLRQASVNILAFGDESGSSQEHELHESDTSATAYHEGNDDDE